MSRHDELIRLRHMPDHAAEAIAMVSGKKRDDLDADRHGHHRPLAHAAGV